MSERLQSHVLRQYASGFVLLVTMLKVLVIFQKDVTTDLFPLLYHLIHSLDHGVVGMVHSERCANFY